MEQRRPAPGEFYRHFKNKYYQIIGIAKHSETKEEMVVYQALYDDFGMYVRPLSMFVSEVDRVKYPSVTQKYRFEKVSPDQIGVQADTGYQKISEPAMQKNIAIVQEPQAESDMDNLEEVPSPVLMGFLDQDTYEDKLKYLVAVRQKLTDDIIDAMAASLDITVPEGGLDARFASLKSCVAAHARYECTRLR